MLFVYFTGIGEIIEIQNSKEFICYNTIYEDL